MPSSRSVFPVSRRARTRRLTLLPVVCALLAGCGEKSSARATPTPAPASTPAAPAAAPAAAEVPRYTYQVVGVYPHDPAAFTQGLVYLKGVLFETTGLNGSSSLRKVDLQTGRVLQQSDLPFKFFGEGMTIIGEKIFHLTWRNQKGFVYNLSTFEVEREFTYAGEGWGLTTDGRVLILSDGTNQIRFLDPETFKVLRTISVFDRGQPLTQLNELEYIKGEIFANVWQTNTIVRIDPATGALLGTIDCTGLLPPGDRRGNTDVLNGIAYDASGDRLFLTGKNWPKLFEVQLQPAK
jgi:glutamine cyclotransferase